MFERFTDRARRVVVAAQDEARGLSHNYIGTEHLLLALVGQAEGVGVRVLEMLDISEAAVRERVEAIIGHGQASGSGHIPFTPRAKKVLEQSLREALQFGHHYIGTEHILLGLIREGEGVAAQVLVSLGADLQAARAAVAELSPPAAAKSERQLHPMHAPVRLASRAEILDALAGIHDRLAAIEAHLGITPGSKPAGGGSAAAGGGSEAGEGPTPP
jgi:ATP-dependent Clp protease ATP-binding subunit ClpC